MLQFTSSSFTFAVTNSVWVSMDFHRPSLAAPHILPMPCTSSLLPRASLLMLRHESAPAWIKHVQPERARDRSNAGKHVTLEERSWTDYPEKLSLMQPDPHKTEQLARSVSRVRMVNSVTCLCIVKENVVKVFKIQKVIVRGIGLWIIFPFPNFLRYGFINLKMNTHTLQTLKPLLALYSPVQLGLCVQCAGECHLPAH